MRESFSTAERSAWSTLVDAIEQLSATHSLEQVIDIVRTAARRISGADGVTFVLRDGGLCYYVDEDAIAPLWKGQRFPMSACISGWAMLNKQKAIVPDIYADARIPHDAYRPTFVKSLLMVPVGIENPIAAIGAYWADHHEPDENEVTLFESLARATATAIANVSLEASLRSAAEKASAQAAEIQRAYEQTKRDAEHRLRIEEQLHQAQKMEAVGQLTGGLAHDFNNLLAVIMGNLELLLEDQTAKGQPAKMATAALEAANRGAQLVRHLLAFSRRQPLQPEPISLNGLVTGLHALLERTLGENIAIRTHLADNLWPAIVDPSQVETALINMAVNARDAMPNGGRLTIETGNKRLDDAYAQQHLEVTAGQYVMVAVTDTGGGMTADVLQKAFDPFFTTKELGKGTGLGLSQVHGFVKQSHGHIKIYSEVGVGTTVRVYLPRAQSVAAAAPAATPASPAPVGHGEMILVVEDRPDVRSVACRQLARLGYRVSDAADANGALRALGSIDRVDLLFTDVVLPDSMSGVDLANEARRLHPSLKVLYTSGFPDAARIGGKFSATDVLLSKPYRIDELARKLRQVLDETR
jgi:signal transduction histidine kinase